MNHNRVKFNSIRVKTPVNLIQLILFPPGNRFRPFAHLVHSLLQLQGLRHSVLRAVPVPSGRRLDVRQHDVAATLVLIGQEFHGVLALLVRRLPEVLVQAR